MKLFRKIDLGKLGVFSFILFFLLTPLLPKVRVAEGVFVEPLVPFLGLSLLLIVLGSWKTGKLSELGIRVKELVFPNHLAIAYFVLMTILLMSFVYGYFMTRFFSPGDLLRLFKYILYFLPFPLAIYAGRSLGSKSTNKILFLLVLVGVITAIISIARVILTIKAVGWIDFWTYSVDNRSVGFLGQYIDPRDWSIGLTGKSAGATYGLYSSVVLAACLALTSRFKEFSRRWWLLVGAAVVVIFGAILYTLSRGATIAAFLVFLAWVVWMVGSKKKRLAVFLSSLALIVSSSIFIWINPAVYGKFSSTIQVEETDEPVITVDSSTMGRIERWGRIIRSFEMFPPFAVFGVGYNTKNLFFFSGVQDTHSLFLDLWARGGLLALFLLIGVWILLFGTLFRFLFSRDAKIRALAFILGGFALGWFIDNLISGEQFFSDAPMIAFWGVLGLVESLRQLNRETEGSKKVLIALTSSGVGGAPQVVYDLLSHLPKGINFDFVIAAPAGGVFNRKFRRRGYTVYPIPFDRIGPRGVTKLLKVVREEGIDLINSHGKGAGLYARKIGFLTGVPVVQTFHGLHYGYRNRLVRFFYLWLERFLTLFTRFVVNVSPSQEKEGVRLGVFSKEKAKLVVNGIDTQSFDSTKVSRPSFRSKLGLRPKDLVVAMVARFDDVKGHARFIRLVPDLVRAVPNLKIVFAGGGEKEKEARRLAKSLGVSASTLFLGERSDVPRILKVSDILILPSFHEGMPLVVLEAMAARKPVVGSDVVGIKDLVRDGETGYLVDFDRGAEVVESIEKLSRSVTLRRKMGERGRQFVEQNFGMDKFVNSTLKVYQQALVEDGRFWRPSNLASARL